jgi:hypothetical protein
MTCGRRPPPHPADPVGLPDQVGPPASRGVEEFGPEDYNRESFSVVVRLCGET